MKSLVILLISSILLLAGCNEDGLLNTENATNEPAELSLKKAKKTAPTLKGIIEVDYTRIPKVKYNHWNGTVDFGSEIGTFQISYLTKPLEIKPNDSQAKLFNEDFIIYKKGTSWFNAENILMRGSYKALLVKANKTLLEKPWKYVANGTITKAIDPFESWMGCTVHSKGIVYLNDSRLLKSTIELRIN